MDMKLLKEKENEQERGSGSVWHVEEVWGKIKTKKVGRKKDSQGHSVQVSRGFFVKIRRLLREKDNQEETASVVFFLQNGIKKRDGRKGAVPKKRKSATKANAPCSRRRKKVIKLMAIPGCGEGLDHWWVKSNGKTYTQKDSSQKKQTLTIVCQGRVP